MPERAMVVKVVVNGGTAKMIPLAPYGRTEVVVVLEYPPGSLASVTTAHVPGGAPVGITAQFQRPEAR
jgi:hypothetical protein